MLPPMNLNRLLLLALAWLTAFAAQAQTVNFYDQNTVQNISLTFTQANWDYQLDTATVGHDSYIIAVRCTINGVNFDSVGVKYKGNSSYNANNRKNPIHIELDHVRNQSYQGFTDVKLSNGLSGPVVCARGAELRHPAALHGRAALQLCPRHHQRGVLWPDDQLREHQQAVCGRPFLRRPTGCL